MSSPGPRGAARTGLAGAVVAGIAFFDGVFLGAPIALLAASFRPGVVFVAAIAAVVVVVSGCCRWLDRRWDDWRSGNGTRIEAKLTTMRASRMLRHPVMWIERGSDRSYAFAAAIVNPILVVAFSRLGSGKPVGERRIMLGSIAYAVPYVALWSLVGLAVGGAVRSA